MRKKCKFAKVSVWLTDGSRNACFKAPNKILDSHQRHEKHMSLESRGSLRPNMLSLFVKNAQTCNAILFCLHKASVLLRSESSKRGQFTHCERCSRKENDFQLILWWLAYVCSIMGPRGVMFSILQTLFPKPNDEGDIAPSVSALLLVL